MFLEKAWFEQRLPNLTPLVRRETFPLLQDPVSYSPDTMDIWSNRSEMDYWLSILGEQVDNIVQKAIASEGNSPGNFQGSRILQRAQDGLVVESSIPWMPK